LSATTIFRNVSTRAGDIAICGKKQAPCSASRLLGSPQNSAQKIQASQSARRLIFAPDVDRPAL